MVSHVPILKIPNSQFQIQRPLQTYISIPSRSRVVNLKFQISAIPRSENSKILKFHMPCA